MMTTPPLVEADEVGTEADMFDLTNPADMARLVGGYLSQKSVLVHLEGAVFSIVEGSIFECKEEDCELLIKHPQFEHPGSFSLVWDADETYDTSISNFPYRYLKRVVEIAQALILLYQPEPEPQPVSRFFQSQEEWDDYCAQHGIVPSDDDL